MQTVYERGLATFDNSLLGGLSLSMNGRRHYWVDGIYGNNGDEGLSPNKPLKTMARAFALIKSGDVIHVNGNITEQLNTPAGVFDVMVIGEGTRPRHSDAHTSTSLESRGGRSGATWKPPASPAATTPLLKIRQQGWIISNILFQPHTDKAAIEFVRDAAAGDSERDSSHSAIIGCRFAGGLDGILFSGTEHVFDILIRGNIFNDQTGTSIKGGDFCYRALIEHNTFGQNANHIVLAATQSYIQNNMFGSFTTMSIDLNGGAGLNVVTKNYLSGTYSIGGGYRKSNANDEWAGNWNTLTGGITIADPA